MDLLKWPRIKEKIRIINQTEEGDFDTLDFTKDEFMDAELSVFYAKLESECDKRRALDV